MNQLRRHAALGFSIIEMMVAMVLGLLLIAGVMQVFLGNRQAQRSDQSVAHVSENGRIAMDLIAEGLRASGYHGCSNQIGLERQMQAPPLFTVRSTDLTIPVSADFGVGSVAGYELSSAGTWAPGLDTSLSGLSGMRQGSDMLVIYFGEPTKLVPTGNIYGSMDITATLNGEAINNGEHLIIDNCRHGDLFTVTNAPGTGATVTIKHDTSANKDGLLMASSDYPYDPNSTISRLVAHVYYVKKSGRKTPVGEDIYSLYRWDGSGAPYELVEGVEYMRVLYGENMQADPSLPISIRYVSAGNVTNWANVYSVQIALLAQSSDSVRSSDDANTYKLLDRDIAASGTYQYASKRSLHRVYTSTIELRNRVE